MNELKGTGVAMITPFTSSGAIDYAAFPKLIDHYIDSGIDYLVVLGTTAETATLSKQEQTEVARKVVEINAGRLPLVLGKGGNNTHALVEEIQTTNFEATVRSFRFVHIIIVQIKRESFNTLKQWQQLHPSL